MPNYSAEIVGQISCYIKNNAGNLLHNNKKWTLWGVSISHQEKNFWKFKIIYVTCRKWKVKQSNYKPGQALKFEGGWGSRISRQLAQECDKLVSCRHRPSLPPGNIPGTHICFGSYSSVGMVTDQIMGGTGWNSGGDEILRPSRPNRGSNQPPVKLVLETFRV